MLHLRIITPPQLTTTVLGELVDDPGVTHITADRGAATKPPGDLVSCDVVRASVNPLLRRLRSAGVAERGGITMTEPEAVISTAADRAQAQIRTPEIDTVVWEEVAARTSDDSVFSVGFGALMVLAGIIAAIAVLTNNPVLVVGAMIVSPDYGPMAALSVALVNWPTGRPGGRCGPWRWDSPWPRWPRSCSPGRPRAWPDPGAVPGRGAPGDRPADRGQPGRVRGCRCRRGGRDHRPGPGQVGGGGGVLVSITTIPAASNVGVALATGSPSEAGKSLVILLVNLAGLLAGGVLMLLGTRVWARRIEKGRVIFRPKTTPPLTAEVRTARVRSEPPTVATDPVAGQSLSRWSTPGYCRPDARPRPARPAARTAFSMKRGRSSRVEPGVPGRWVRAHLSIASWLGGAGRWEAPAGPVQARVVRRPARW